MKYVLILFLLIAAAPAFAAENLMDVYQAYDADSQMALDRPHRSAPELGSWLSETVADALLYTPGHTADKLGKIKPYFSEQGYKAYLLFLTSQGYGDAITNQTLRLSTIVQNAPLLIGQGSSAGRYAWAFELPVVMSNDMGSKSVVLRIQVGRAAKAPGPNGVLIENWQQFTEGDTPATDAPADVNPNAPLPTP